MLIGRGLKKKGKVWRAQNLKDVNVCKNLTRLLTSNLGRGVIYGSRGESFDIPEPFSPNFMNIFHSRVKFLVFPFFLPFFFPHGLLNSDGYEF